jgi:oligopeptide transport system substrate-binding protein
VRVLLSLLLVACQPDPYPGERGDVLHASLRLLPKTVDPALVGDEGSGMVASQVYEGLLTYHPYARPYTLIPALASELPTMSEDGRTYTFTLRDDVVFHDDPCFPDGEGRQATAHDFLFALKRLAHPTTRTNGWWLLDGRIAGLDAWRDAVRADIEAERTAGRTPGPLHGLERPATGLEVVDDFTLRFHLTEPYPQFLWTLAMPYTAVVPREAVEHYGESFRNHPVGTGPFRMTEYNPVYRAVYAANDEYRDVRVPDPEHVPADRWPGWEADVAAGHLANAGERLPLVDGLEIRFIQEDQPRWLYFSNGYLDWLNPPKDNIRDALPGGELSDELKRRGVRVQPLTELGTVYTALNTADPLLSNVGVRRAIALAFDHRWTVDNLYGGQAVVATSMIPPGVAGFDPSMHPYHAPDGGAQLERAREVLAEAGYPDGIDPRTGDRLHLTFESTGAGVTQRAFAQRFVDEMRRLGLNVDVVVNTFPQVTEKMRNKQYQVAGLAWGLDYPDAQNILQLLYGPNGAPGINRTNYSNPEFDAMFTRAALLPDGPERTRLYEQMAAIIGRDVPVITRVHRIRQNLQQPWLHGLKYTDVHFQHWRYASVDAAERHARVTEWNRPVLWPLIPLFLLALSLLGLTIRGQRR